MAKGMGLVQKAFADTSPFEPPKKRRGVATPAAAGAPGGVSGPSATGGPPSFGGFQTGSGKKVAISEESMAKGTGMVQKAMSDQSPLPHASTRTGMPTPSPSPHASLRNGSRSHGDGVAVASPYSSAGRKTPLGREWH